jgi:hypothetical protein
VKAAATDRVEPPPPAGPGPASPMPSQGTGTVGRQLEARITVRLRTPPPTQPPGTVRVVPMVTGARGGDGSRQHVTGT